MIRTTFLFLLASVIYFTVSDLAAGDFRKDIKGVEGSIYNAGPPAIGGVPVPAPIVSPGGGNKWWSVNIAGSAHKAAMKAALAFVDRNEFPDMARAQEILLTGTNDESGHLPDQKINNGGRTKDLWYGKTPESLGGVLRNYQHFRFSEAYARLGTICHLTQDQAVPNHVANVLHGINDSFEGYSADGNKVRMAASRDNGEMAPYAYYQDLQDDTRRHLAAWVHPGTGKPYWTPARDAPPLGQDATFGPWGSYGPDGDVYSVRENNNSSNSSQQITASPEIRVRQLIMAAAATAAVLKSASRRLPPLVYGLAVTPEAKGATVRFTIFDNRSGEAGYSLALHRQGEQSVTVATGRIALHYPESQVSANQGAAPPPELMLKGEVRVSLDLTAMEPGNYALEVSVTDTDGNTVPEEVNHDDITANDTRSFLRIP